MKVFLRAALVLALVGCGGSRATPGGAGGAGGGATSDGAAGADARDTQASDGAGDDRMDATGAADTSADGPADAADGAGVQCTPGTKQCAGSTAEICVATGNAWNRLACPNGCAAGVCNPMSLETGWKVYQYNLTDDSIQTPASYTFEMNGLVAVQSANPMASVYYNDTVLPEGIVVTGRFGVHTTSDDDLVGFVFGWQDPEHTYLFDWKQATQPDGTCGTANAGASLKLISSATALDKCADLWESAGTTKVTPLVAATVNPIGWMDNVDYDLTLSVRPGAITIDVMQGTTKVVSITSNDTTYRSGKFGFFNYSQEAVRYEFFSISPIQ
ncbi:MAG TPA: hypothetical protein VFN38_04565 [Gemmatimonadaceae bacterium]|nr:hypothetical protein [Gemmatimonadaceae bacterium]